MAQINRDRTACQELKDLSWIRDVVGEVVRKVTAAAAPGTPQLPVTSKGSTCGPIRSRPQPAELVVALRLYQEEAGQSFVPQDDRHERPEGCRLDAAHSIVAARRGRAWMSSSGHRQTAGATRSGQRRWASACRRIQLGRLDAAPTAAPPVLRAVPPAAGARIGRARCMHEGRREGAVLCLAGPDAVVMAKEPGPRGP